MYFVHAMAGSYVGFTHKFGMYNLRINYAVAEVLQYMYDDASSKLKCLIHEDDESAAPRYYNSFKCR